MFYLLIYYYTTMKVFNCLSDAICFVEQLILIDTSKAIEELKRKGITKQNNIIYIVDEYSLLE